MRFANAINRLFVAAQTDQCVTVRTAPFVYKRESRYRGSAEKNRTSVTSHELPYSSESEIMARSVVSTLCIVCLVLTIVAAKPVPQRNGKFLTDR